MADSGPSRPRRPPREGFAAPDFFRESSGARLGAVFRPFPREVRRIPRCFDFRVKKLGFQGPDFLIRSFLIGLRPVSAFIIRPAPQPGRHFATARASGGNLPLSIKRVYLAGPFGGNRNNGTSENIEIPENPIFDRNPPEGKGKWHFSLWEISRVSLGNLYKNRPALGTTERPKGRPGIPFLRSSRNAA